MREELLELEKKILEIRMQMADLLVRIDVEDDVENKAKLRALESEIGYVVRQYRTLEAKLKVSQQEQPVQAVRPVQPVQPIQPVQPQVVTSNAGNKKNLENTIGTSLMGVLASGLIFIGIILFATLGLPYLPDALKMLACYVVSVAIIVVSMHKLNKSPGSKFYLSLAGCGVGALYISLLLTNIYFGYINDILLFVCITIWAFFMCALSKIRHKLFAVIGHVGITIAIIFGAILCVSQGDMLKFIMLTVFFVVSTGTLYGVHFDKDLVKNILPNVFAIINTFVVLLASGAIIDVYYNAFYICIALVIIALLAVLTYCDWSRSQLGYGIMTIAYVILLLIVSGRFFEYDENIGMFAYIISMVMLVVLELKNKSDNTGKYFAQFILMIFACVGLASTDDMFVYLMLPLLAVPWVALGVWKDNPLCKYAGMLTVFFFLLSDIDMTQKLTFSLIILIGLYVVAFITYETRAYRNCLHLLSIVFLLSAVSDVINEMVYDYQAADAIIFMMITVFNIVMFFVATKRLEYINIYMLINAIMMFVGLGMISDNTPLHLLVIIVTVAAFMINSKRYLERESLFPGIYVGIKFTILLIVILTSFETENYILSILLIIAAIICIIIGFMFKYKSLRVYGLALSMISIFKLVMVDIQYDNTLGNALSFLISGALCFVISMIYNYIGKKIEEVD